jgi:ankyrin repeat protein
MPETTKNGAEKQNDKEREARQTALDEDLRAAARNGEAQKAAALLAAGADPKARCEAGHTALMLAASSRDAATAHVLIPVSDLEVKNERGDTALLFAVFYSGADMVRSLLDGGASSAVVGDGGCTALQWAVSRGEIETVAFLAPNSDLEHVDRRGETAEQIAERNGDEPVKACLGRERARREKATLAGAVGDAMGAGPGLTPRKALAL